MKRLHYFDQQFLMEPDFTAEQTYHLGMRRQLNQALHSAGIAQNLVVVKKADRIVTVKAGATFNTLGVAIDAQGREIVLEADQDLNLDDPRFPPGSFPAKQTVYVSVAYAEAVDPPISGEPYGRRWTESGTLNAALAQPSDGSVVLASFLLDDQARIPSQINPGQKAGAVLAPASVTKDAMGTGAVGDAALDDPLRQKINGAVAGVANLDAAKANRGGDTFTGQMTFNGLIQCAAWHVWQPVKDLHAPARGVQHFSTGGGVLLIFASGSGCTQAATGSIIGIDVLIDEGVRGSALVFATTPNVHYTFATTFLLPVNAGSHDFWIRGYWDNSRQADTKFSDDDNLNVVILELPFAASQMTNDPPLQSAGEGPLKAAAPPAVQQAAKPRAVKKSTKARTVKKPGRR